MPDKDPSLRYGDLHKIELTSGIYPLVNKERINRVVRATVVEDPDRLLERVLRPETMEVRDHARLLLMLVKMGFTSAYDEIGVGPALDGELKPVPEKMAVVHYESIRERYKP